MKQIKLSLKGLTIIELLVGILILTLISTVTLVTFGILDRRKLETQALNLASDLMWARTLATCSRSNYTVNFDTNAENYTIYDGAGTLKKGERLGVNLLSVKDDKAVSKTSLTFFYLGTAENRTINLTHSGRYRNVNVSEQTGNVKLE